MTSTGWIDTGEPRYVDSSLNGLVVACSVTSDAEKNTTPNEIANALSAVNLGELIGFTSIHELLTGITAYPLHLYIRRSGNVNYGNLKAYNTEYPIKVADIDYGFISSGYRIAEHKVSSHNSFKDYEPYRKLDLWLPYYGIVNVPLTRVTGKYVEVLLYVDFKSGQAQYVIGASDTHIELPYTYVLFSADLSSVEIISSHTFQLGYKCPIGATGATDWFRNMALNVASTVATVYSAGTFVPSHLTPTTTTTVKEGTKVTKVRNKKTGRMVTGRTVKTDESTVREYSPEEGAIENYKKSRIASTVGSSIASLSSVQAQGNVSYPSNTFLMFYGSKSVQVIYTEANIVPYTAEFDHLYGRPLGETRKLSSVHGFADISAVHLEGSGFSSATTEELNLLETLLLSGVILP